MSRPQMHRLVTAAVALLLVWPATAEGPPVEDRVEQANSDLLKQDFKEAERDVRAPSNYLANATGNARDPTNEELEESSNRIKALAEDIENDPDTQRIDEVVAGARALARQCTSTTATQQSYGLRTLFRDLGSDFKHLASRDSLVVVTVGGGLAIGAHPFDSKVNDRLANDAGVFKAGNVIGSSATLMGASVATYGIGRVTGHNRVAHLGLDLLRAQIITEAMVESTKVAVRRPRPDGSSGYAFPSGHAAMTFATATVIRRHHGWKLALPIYGLAGYVAVSRLHDNVHSLSDVVFGAAVGIVAGSTVTRHGRSSFAVVPFATPGGKGVALVRAW